MTNDKESQMTTTYQATGRLDFPVSDLSLARQYLDEPMEEYIQYCSEDLVPVVHTIRWDLTTEQDWKVTLVTNRPLTDQESKQISEWISGQNSDGLGEGFEQQSFAEIEPDDEDEEDWAMASFDWMTNPCTLVQVA
jgi:hypothetical protein